MRATHRPSRRAVDRVEQQQVRNGSARPSGARASAASSPTRAGRRRPQLQVVDPGQRQALEPAVRADEPRHELRRGRGEDLGRRRELLEDAAASHHRDEVAHLDRLVDVVGHEQDRLGELLLEAQELVLQALADDRVHRAERLVHQHHRRVRGERPGHAHALPLAAGELRRVAVARTARGPGRRAPAAPRRARRWRRWPSRAAAAPWRRSRRSSGAGTARSAG